MDDNIKNFLNKVEQLKSDKFKVSANSLSKSIDCEPLTFKQQKDIISTITDGIVGPLKFQKILNDVIIENTESKELKITDKTLIILQLRRESVGTKVKTKDGEHDILDEVIDNVKNIKPTYTKTITGAVTVELEVPTLIQDNQVISVCVDTVKRESEKDIGKSLGDIYTYEIVKYVKSVSLGEDVVNFQEISVRDRVKIVDNLPLSINKEIIKFIQDNKNQERDALKYKISDSDYIVDIDVAFFDS